MGSAGKQTRPEENREKIQIWPRLLNWNLRSVGFLLRAHNQRFAATLTVRSVPIFAVKGSRSSTFDFRSLLDWHQLEIGQWVLEFPARVHPWFEFVSRLPPHSNEVHKLLFAERNEHLRTIWICSHVDSERGK